jgi:hypothetical protein
MDLRGLMLVYWLVSHVALHFDVKPTPFVALKMDKLVSMYGLILQQGYLYIIGLLRIWEVVQASFQLQTFGLMFTPYRFHVSMMGCEFIEFFKCCFPTFILE